MNTISNISLPTQLSEPQFWGEGGNLHPLRLCAAAPLARELRTAIRKPSVSSPASGLRHNLGAQLLLLAGLAVLSIVGYFLISRFVATAVVVKGRSMNPTLQDGDRFILNRWSYFRSPPQRGDVVVVKDPGHNDYAVKRIVALPGEMLLFKGGEVLVNGKHLFEPYLAAGTQTYLPDSFEKLIMTGKDQFFVLGDNRSNSEDSRFYGAINRSQIIGSITR